MENVNFISAIVQLGFSVVMCLLLYFNSIKRDERYDAQLEAEREAHKEEMQLFLDLITNNTVTINNNTNTLMELCELIKHNSERE